MSRRMSCALTIDAVKSRTKTVTRRHPDTWINLRPGDGLTLIEKGMGLAKGSKQVVLAEVVVISNQIETLAQVDEREVQLEGLGHMTPQRFRRFWADAHGHADHDNYDLGMIQCRRIAWSYTIINTEVQPVSDPTALDASNAMKGMEQHEIDRLLGWISGANPGAVIDAVAAMREWDTKHRDPIEVEQ